MRSWRNIPMASMPASPNFSSRRSRPKRIVLPRPRRRGRPNRSGRGSPPKAPRRRSRPRPRLTPRPPNRRGSPPKKPNRWRRIRPLPPSRSAPRLKRLPRTKLPPIRHLPRLSPDKAVNLAALSDSAAPADVTKSVQTELRRVGCLTGSADGEWNSGAQRSLTLFNRYAGTKLDTKLASVDTLDAHQAEDVAGLSAGLRTRLQGRWRPLQQDHLRRRLVPQRRQ